MTNQYLRLNKTSRFRWYNRYRYKSLILGIEIITFNTILIMAYDKDEVWKFGKVVAGFDEKRWRKDECGAWMDYNKYGNTDSKYGWQVDHIFPSSVLEDNDVAESDRDNIINLRPMQWKNNDVKQKDYPTYDSAVTSSGNTNVDKDNEYTVSKQKQQALKEFFAKHGNVDITSYKNPHDDK